MAMDYACFKPLVARRVVHVLGSKTLRNEEYDPLVTGVLSYNTSETVCDVIMYMYLLTEISNFFPWVVLAPPLLESWLHPCCCTQYS